jgi:radical SAM superfamily enzyme YgiQ (UPF0313 family)
MFEDDNVTADAKRAKLLFSRMIEEGLDFVWDTPNGVGVWSMDEEMIDLMKKSGCINLNFPVESGSQRVLKDIIKKPLMLEKVKRLTTYCKTIGSNSRPNADVSPLIYLLQRLIQGHSFMKTV